ncbi:AAA family ATPase [Nocardia blacklockiae]|uniref:AAA family ATPase n=1 Tax=Nocardia blacklockiae TaxID=480036 RepID=UPI001895F599|nr:AAA family ATPase [Nocardia blacklockiae]MBF6173612.1 ATP-binding protein [Nocardia blacklockiae]
MALRDCAHRLDGCGVLVIAGFPSSGKSTAARFAAEVAGATVLDKDSYAPGLEDAVMAALTGNQFDRDSDTYHSVVAPHLYTGLVRVGLTVGARHPVVLDAPFLAIIRQAAATGNSLREYLFAITDITVSVPVTTVWIDAPTDQIRARMAARGAERDSGKLADWETYRTGVLDSGLRDLAHSVVDHVISN